MLRKLAFRLQHWNYNRKYSFQKIRLDDLLDSDNLILDLRDWNSDTRAGDFNDSLVITSIVGSLKPKLYWEIGTGDGRTSLLVARNTPPGSEICTIDPGYPDDTVKGKIFRNRPEANKIKQYGGYSTKFDFSPWFGKTDLVFVDGSHELADVLNDCEVAIKLIAPGGWILWHDVAIDTPGVPEALKQCSYASKIGLIAGTRYALFRDPGLI